MFVLRLYSLPTFTLPYYKQTFRILDGKDGKVDGVLSIVKQDTRAGHIGRGDIANQAKDALAGGRN